MLKKTLISLAVSGYLFGSSAFALELGELSLKSSRSEPFRAEVFLTDTANFTAKDVSIRLGSESEFRLAGITPIRALSQLKFQVINRDNRLVVDIRSAEPLNASELHFVLAARWPSGQVVREYQTPLSSAAFIEKSGEGVVQSAQSSSVSFRPTSTPAITSVDGNELRVIRGNTLWSIADKNAPSSDLTIYQTMMAIQALNEDAFHSNNINLLKEGSILRLPTQDQIAVFNRLASKEEFERQNLAWEALKREGKIPKSLGKAQLNTQANSNAQTKQKANEGDKLSLVSGSSVLPEDSSNSNENNSEIIKNLEGKLSESKELLDKEKREKSDLESKLKELSEQQETLEELISLKDAQLAELQKQMISAQQIIQEQKNTVDQLLEADQLRREAEMIEESSLVNQIFKNPIIVSLIGVVMMLLGILIGFLLKRRSSKKQEQFESLDNEFDLSSSTMAVGATAATMDAMSDDVEEDPVEKVAESTVSEVEEEDPFAFEFYSADDFDDLDLADDESSIDEFEVDEDEDEDEDEDDSEVIEIDDQVALDDTFESESDSNSTDDGIPTVEDSQPALPEIDNSEEESFVSNLLDDSGLDGIDMPEETTSQEFDDSPIESAFEDALTDIASEFDGDDDLDVPEFGENEASEDVEESDEEEEFDFFDASGDEVATKLDLARAYMDMGDEEGARVILDDVVESGNETQIAEAQNMMDRMSPSE
ncbi:FimV/HubP family polar landmark protein [Marinomonas sp. 2405UD68-3]|uniref:FimV/HubP family polar landmark protein n=1 Tax=Marinomonas sp. 2405UD68-3 TaxID=3391835 RepID=UPI0039C9E3BB